MYFQMLMFAISGEKLTMRLRVQAFEAMLQQEMGWYDDPSNKTGALCTRLSSDASKVQGVRNIMIICELLIFFITYNSIYLACLQTTGSRVGTVLQSFFTLIIAVVISLTYSVKLGLLALLFVPFLVGGIYLQTKIIMGHDAVEKKAFEASANVSFYNQKIRL